MITETDSTDRDRLQSWIEQDDSKKHFVPEEWYTGKGFLSFRYDDQIGTVCYIRIDKQSELMRIFYLFGPVSEISQKRVAKAILKTIPMLEKVAREQNMKGLIYDSVSQKLIDFVFRAFAFVPAGDNNYKLEFEVAHV